MLALTYRGVPLGTRPEDFRTLTRSDDCVGDRDELWRRFGEEGYLFLPGLLDTDEVLAARTEVLKRLWDHGVLDKNYSMLDAVAVPDSEFDGAATGPFMPLLARDNSPLEKVLYDGPMMKFLAAPRRISTTPGFAASVRAWGIRRHLIAILFIWGEGRKICTHPGHLLVMCPLTRAA